MDFADFDNDRELAISRAQAAGVEFIINVGSSLKGCLASLDLASRYRLIYAAIGIHPHNVGEIDSNVFRQIEGIIRSDKVVAIGEVGLDFYRNLSPAQAQKESFAKFISLSISSGLPLIIHSRQAEPETLRILKEASDGKLKGVVHCFSGSGDFLESCLGLGLCISFTGNVTYKKSDNLRELVRLVPEDRLLLETDCPYLSPEGMRGKRNEPMNVKLLAKALSELKNCNIEEIAAKTTQNAKRLFRLE